MVRITPNAHPDPDIYYLKDHYLSYPWPQLRAASTREGLDLKSQRRNFIIRFIQHGCWSADRGGTGQPDRNERLCIRHGL